MSMTGEEVGYHDAMRQVTRAMQRRYKALEEELESATEREAPEIRGRMKEVKHMLEVIETLHR